MKSPLSHPRSSAIAAAAAVIVLAAGAWPGQAAPLAAPAAPCPGGDTGITLSPGFCATVFADIWGMSAILQSLPMGPSTQTPGAAATITSTRRRPADFCSR